MSNQDISALHPHLPIPPNKGDNMVVTSMSRVRTRILITGLALLLTSLTACDSDSSGRGRNNGIPSDPVRVQGTVQAGPAQGVTVVAFAVDSSGNKAQTLGQSASDANGNFQIVFNNDSSSGGYSGVVLLEATGGSYTDEARQSTVSLGSVFKAVIDNSTPPANASFPTPVTASVTILSTLAAEQALRGTGGLTQANVLAANASINSLYNNAFDILSTPLSDPNNASGGSNVAADTGDFTVALAGFSRLALDLGLTPDQLFDALKADIADGRLDGRSPNNTSTLADDSVITRLARSTTAYLASNANVRGLTIQATTLATLSASDGNISRNNVPGLDNVGPKVIEHFPLPGTTGAFSNSKIFIRVNEELDPSTVTSSNITVRNNVGTIPGTISYDAASQSIVFTPATILPTNSTITINTTTNVQDLAGNPLQTSDNFTFSTGLLAQGGLGFATNITAVPPANTGADINQVVALTFDRPLDPSSLRASGNLTLMNGTDEIDFSIGYNLGTNTVILAPTIPLPNSSTITVALSGSLADAFGNVLSTAFSQSFTTNAANVADTGAPTVLAVDPIAGSLLAQSSSQVTVNFSESVDPTTVIANTQLRLGTNLVSVTKRFFSQSSSLVLIPDAPLSPGQTYTLTAGTNVLDLAGNSLSTPFSSSFTVTAPALTITTTTLPTAVVNQVYSQQIQTIGGNGAITFSASGTLPTGLTLSPAGVLSGTPTVAGTVLVTITATDSSTPTPQTASQALSIRVDANVAVPTVSFDQLNSATNDEATQNFLVNIRLDTPTTLSSPVTADVTVNGGTATNGTDYLQINTIPITFPVGTTSGTLVTVGIGVQQDSLAEGNETIQLLLSNVQGSGAILGGSANHTVTITDDDPNPTVSLSSANVLSLTEGASSTVTAVLSNPSAQSITVPFTVGGTASSATDHNLVAGNLTFAPGQSSASVSFQTTQDLLDEDDIETITVTLGTPSAGATLGSPSTQTININDDDALAIVSIDSLTNIDEDSGTATFTVSLNTPHGRSSSVTVDASTAPGTALSGTDFNSNNGTLSFAAGETTKSFMVTITDDTLDEDPESFTVVLGSANLLTISSSMGTGVGTIVDNDNPANVSFAMATQSVSENAGSVTLTVSLDNANGSGKAITVPFSVTGTAQNPADHDLASGQFPVIPATSIPPGQSSASITFNVVDDNISELAETIIVTLGTPTNAGLGANPVLTVTVNDNEATPTANLDVLLGANVQNPNVANGNRIELDENAGTVTLRASLSNPSSQDVTGSFTLGAGSSTAQPPEVTDLDTPGTRVRLYIGQNNGSGTVEAYTAFNGAPFTTELQNTVTPGNNQNVTLDTLGNLYHTGNTPPSIRVITDVANRPANDPFDPNKGDRIIVGAATTLVGPRGLDVDTRRERMLIADFNGTKLVVFDLNANGNVAPLGSTDLSVITGVTGRPWDLDYESQDDLLFVAMTDGNVLVYENYLGSGTFGSAGPTRLFAPTDGTRAGENIHGIIFNRVRNELYLSDVGAATLSTAPGFDTDGRVFVIQNANTAGGGAGTTVTAAITINTGANVRLGNPVDISFDGGNLYVVEKTNSSTVPADTNKILIYGGFQATVDAGVSGDIAPTATIVLPATAAPESSTIDPGTRLDHNFSTRSFTIPAGQTSVETSFRISEDTRDEENESIDLSLTMLSNADAGPNAARSIQVQDNDVQPTININSITNSEGNNAVLTVSLTEAPGRPVTVNFSTMDGTAVSVANPPFPEDFTAIPTTTLTLNEGESFKTITVIINDDANNEAPEDFTVNLSNNPSNALPGILTGTVTIADNDALPVIDIAAVGPTTVDENVGQITFNVTLNAQSAQTVTADVLIAGVSSTFGSGDFTFTPNPSTVTFAPGETSKSVSVTINDDMVNEVNEQFTASLTNISATAAPGTTTSTITINDNDSFTVTIDNPSTGTEGGADASFTVTLSRASEQTLTLDVASLGVAPDPAEAGDFTSPSTLTFSPGTTTRTLTLTVTDDMVNEATETVQSTLSFAQAPNGFDMAGSTLVSSVNINDNDELTVTLTTAVAGAEPSTNATFTATLNRQSEQTPITFDITTGANTADPTEAGDITAPASVTFSGMSVSETVTVTVNDDMINEATEGFSLTLALNGTVNLFSPSNSTLTANNTVADDDTITVVLANTGAGMEPSTNLTYSATLSRQSEQTLNFNIGAVGSGTDPAESTDFTVGTASISFAAGTTTQSFDITVNDDGNNEAIEGLTTSLTLTNTVNGFDTQGSTLSAMAVINDDDLAVISITAQPTTASAIENSNTIQLFDIAISVPTEQNLTVDFAGEGGAPVGATLGADFQLPIVTQLSFPGSSATPFSTTQTVNITVLEDLINEANEVYNIRLLNLAGAINGVSLATTPFASATILDDDPVTVLLSTTTNGMENGAGTPSDATFTATLSIQSEQTINFDVTAMGSGADPAEATDFTLATSTISFAPLSLTQSITVTVNEDAVNEANEGLTSTIALSNVVNGFDPQGSTLTSDAIINDDDDVTISIMTNTGPFPEGNVGDSNTVLFTVSISGDSEQAPMVNFATGTTTTAATDTGDAISDTDFASQTGSLTLNLAAMTRTITVDILEDNVAEQNENFLTALTLNTTARGVTLGNASATATITDDDDADIAFGPEAPVLEGATIPVQVNLSGPKSQAVTVNLRDTLGGTATNGVDSTEENRLFPFTPVALYVVRNNGGATGVDRLGTDLRVQATYDIGANEGSVLDTDGTLYICSDANGVASIRSFNKIAGRAPGVAFDPNQDDIVLGAMTTLTNPKGIDLDTNRNLVFAADNGASEIKVFRLNDSGDVAPQGTTALSERPWDIDYNSATDQLFVVTTSGNVFVFDNYVAGNFAPSGTPTKVITPADGGVKDSINLHGIAFDSANDRLILSDVGLPADATDGAIFVINSVSTVSGLVEYDVKVSGPNTMLGNPVDLAFDGTNIYIAEKSNNFVGIFTLSTLTGGHTNNDVAANAQTAATRPESVTLDRGVRRDHNLTEAASTLTFAPGETSKTVSVMVLDDIRDEPIAPELLELTLENQTGPSNIATVTQNFRLSDNDAAPGISIESVTALEGVGNDPTNPGTFVFVIRLDAPSGQPTGSLPNGTIATIDGTATVADNDYNALTGTFTFAEGSVYVTQVVTINDDAVNEADESFTVRLDTVLFATPNGPIDTTGTITNDDGVPTVSVANVAGVSENGGGTLDFVVTLAPASGQPATIEFSTLTTGTATAGSDFTAISNQTLTFLPGQSLTQTVSVTITDDMINEDNETVIVQLSNPSNAIIDPGATTATGTINDNDDITVSIVSGATLSMEGDTGTTATLGFGLTLSGASEQTVQVRFSTDGTGTATAGADYTVVAQNTVSFAPLSTSATANVVVTGDNITEVNESFGVMLDNVAQGRGVTLAAGQSSSTGVINDNDPFTVSIASAGSVTEGGDLLFPVTIDGGGKTGFAIGQTITVNFSTNVNGVVGDPAEAGDFTGGGTLMFSEATPGTLVMMATVTTDDDGVNELNESLNAMLDSVTGNGGSLGAMVTAGGTINDNDDITVNFSAATVLSFTEGDAGTSPASVELVLSGPSEQTINLSFLFREDSPASARGTAPNQDFVPNNGQVTVTTTPVALSFEVVGDLLDETDPETLTLALSGLNARGVTFQASTTPGPTIENTTINIADNDAPPALSFDLANTQTTLSEAEADGMAQVQFSIDAVSGQDVTFSLSVDGTSTANTIPARLDFTDPTQTLTIPAGQTSVTIQVPINNDLNNEADETIVLSISNPMAATINGSPTGSALQTITINDDDALVVSIDNPNLTEVDGGANNTLNFTVSLNRDTEQVVTVQFATADNTALNVGVGMGDYEAGTGTVTFDGAANFGDRSETVAVQINGDDINEPQETFTVTLSSLNVPGTITPNVGTGTIFDNDPLQISIADQTLVEDSGNNFQFTVTFDRPSEQVILVDFVTDTANVTGDPAEPADITGNNGRLTFAPLVQTQSLTINLVDDNINEANEQFQVILTINGTPDNVSFADNTALGTINDNDDVRVDLTTPITVSEAQSPASFPVQLTDIDNPPALGATEQTILVVAQTAPATMGLQAQGDLTPQANTDFLTKSEVLTFNAATTTQTFDVTIVDDAALPINEPTEFFDVNLSAQGQLPRGVTIGSALETGTIVDNDVVTITIAPPANAIIEGSDGGSTLANFVVTLMGRTTQTIVIDYMAETGGANPGTPNLDYVASTNTLTLQADTVNATRTVNAPVNITADTINEIDQTFQVRIALNGIIGGVQIPTPTALGTITDDDPVTIRVVNNNPAVPSVDQVAEANGPAQFQVIVIGTDPTNPATFTEQTFSVDFTTADGSAVQPGDYTATTQTVTVSGLATNAVALGTTAVAVPVISDTVNETDETFMSAIGNLQGSTNLVTIDAAAAGTTVTIIDDDILVVNLRTRDALTNEGADSFFELFVDTNNPANTATGTEQTFTFDFITMQTTPVQAADNVDFMAINAPVTVTTNAVNPFVLQQTLATQIVSTIDEQAGQQINEPNEDFLGVASNLMNANNVQFTGQAVSVTTNQTILDNDLIIFNIMAGAPVTERDAGGAALDVTFNVTVTGGSDLTAQTFNVPVQIGLAGDTAVAGADYDAAAATITPDLMFNGGPDVVPTNVAIVVPILFDDINEAVESFRVMLGTPTNMPAGVSIGTMPTATQVINDDDVIVFDLMISQASASEAVTNRTFDLVLNAGTMATATAQAFNVDLTPLSGNGANPAAAPGDFNAAPDTEMFDGTVNPDTIAGRQLSVTVVDDALNEQDEDFRAMISLPMAVNGVSINTATATGIILDNDDIVLNYAAGTDNQTIRERGNNGPQMANYAFNFSGATMSQQDIVVSVTAIAGITPPSATAPAGIAGNDYQFIDPAGAAQNLTTLNITIPAGTDLSQLITYMTDAIDDVSGDENLESYRLTTAVTGRGVSVATADQNLEGAVEDVPLLNLNGAGILAVTPFGASFNTSTTALPIAPNTAVINNGQTTSAALLTVDLMGNSTLPGDEVSIVNGNNILVIGTDVFFNNSPIATTVTNPATVATAGGSAQLQIAMLNNISQAATQALVRQIGFRDNNAGGGGRSVTATFTFNTGGGQATEARDARLTINGAFNFTRLIVGNGNAAQGGNGSVPISLSAIAGDNPVGASMTITYPTDGGNISATSVTIDPAIGTDHQVVFNVSTPGTINLQVISASNTVLPSTQIANINFTNAAATTLGSNPLQVTAAALSDAAANPIPVVGVDGVLNIVPVIVLTGGTVTGDAGNTVALPVDITTPMGSSPVALQVDILFNAANIDVAANPMVPADVTPGASATNAGAIVGVSRIAGGIRVVVVSLSNQTLETGRLFDINFQINAGAGGTSNTVTLTNVIVSDSNSATLPNQPINGAVNVN